MINLKLPLKPLPLSQIFLGAATCTGATEAISAVLLCDVATIPEVHQGMLSTKVFEGHLTSQENKKKDTLPKSQQLAPENRPSQNDRIPYCILWVRNPPRIL